MLSTSGPLTRSRTNLFLSYRDSAIRPSHSTYSHYLDDDPILSESQGLMSDAVDGGGGGLGASTSRRGSGAVSGSVEVLPPRWVDLSDRVDEVLQRVKPKISQLDKLHAKHILPGFKDRSAEEREIDALATEITSDFRSCQRLIRQIAEMSRALLQQRVTHANAESTRLELIMAANVQTALATKVQELSGTFRKKQTAYLKHLKGLESKAADLHSHDPLFSLGEDESFSQNTLRSSQATLFVSSHGVDMQQRDAEINAIAQSIVDLADLFKDLSSMVIDQGTLLDRVDFNVEQMGGEVRAAVEELKTATKHQRRSGKCQLIFLLILLIVGCIVVIAYRPSRPPRPSTSTSVTNPPIAALPNEPPVENDIEDKRRRDGRALLGTLSEGAVEARSRDASRFLKPGRGPSLPDVKVGWVVKTEKGKSWMSRRSPVGDGRRKQSSSSSSPSSSSASAPRRRRHAGSSSSSSSGAGFATAAAVVTGAGVLTLAGRRYLTRSSMLCEEAQGASKETPSSTGLFSMNSLPSLPSLPDMADLPSLPKDLFNSFSSSSCVKAFQDLRGSLDLIQKEIEGGEDSARAGILAKKDDVSVHPELGWDAEVRLGTKVGIAERAFLRERKERMKAHFAQLMDLDEAEIDVRDLPVIAMAGSGGGYRAMINTLGSVKAAQESGVWDVVSYVSAISGSCWAINTYYSIGEGNIDRTLDHIKKRMRQHFLDPATLEWLIQPGTNQVRIVPKDGRADLDRSRLIIARFSNPQYILSGAILKEASKAGTLSLVDAYGTAVASRLYVPDDPEAKLSLENLKISHQRLHVDSGEHPLPIYCTIRHEIPRAAEVDQADSESKDEKRTDAERKGAKERKEELLLEGRWMWFETTPHEVGCDELGAWIPTWSLGRAFEGGKSVERVPELSLTIMSGVFASAFCATLYSDECFAQYFKEIKPVLRTLPFFDTINSFVMDRQPQLDSIHPLPPAELPNFLKGLDGKLRPGAPENITELSSLGFMDAGANLNIPYVPLFRRDVDIAIALDASADSQDLWFETAHQYAEARELKSWPRVDWKGLFKNLKDEASTGSSKDEKAKDEKASSDRAASKVDAAKLQEKEANLANGGKAHKEQAINPQTPPVGSAPHSKRLDNEGEKVRKEGEESTENKLPTSQEGEPPLGKCNIWIGSTKDEDTPCRNDNPTVQEVMDRDGISLVYYPLTSGPELENVSEVWCTWRFEYPEDETERLIRLARANFHSGDEQLKTLIRGVYERKKKQRLADEASDKKGRAKL
ncbi:BQ2448_7308 [Microbotryum intermedium]|uniref:Lysophospholipase n=1 Tax=Microbotryum intermedium TaxID=269621 RepID=A0A238FHV4_9BASI|nr:BQ2448_7308 [Microbotryum intermedium]